MDFGDALKLVKTGTKSIQRAGWNGKGQHVYLEEYPGYTIGDGAFKGMKRSYLPVFVLFTAQGQHQPGWVPSQGDLLAEDWQVAVHT